MVDEFVRYIKDKRLNPLHEKNNAFLNLQETRVKDVIDDATKSIEPSTNSKKHSCLVQRKAK